MIESFVHMFPASCSMSGNKLFGWIVWLLLCWIGGTSSGYAQDFDQYERLHSSGNIPADFLLSSQEKYRLELYNLSDNDQRRVRKAKREFYVESSYYINQLLQSGRVLFHDPVSEYIGEVGAYLLRDTPELQEKIRFYAVKSSVANAFSTNNGLILVNVGLLAKLENEAQLAYVLAHEISHFVMKHPMDIFLEARKIERNAQRIFDRGSLENILLAKSNYSREKEQEADLQGLALFKDTEYDLESAASAFDVLKLAHLPFGQVPFLREFLETEHLRFPDTYYLDTLREISARDLLERAEQRTHLEPEIRKEIILKRLAGLDNTGRKKWIIGADRFRTIQQICRFESAFLHLGKRQYEDAIYAAFLLLEEHPESRFLKKIVAHALYSLSKYTNSGRFWDVHKDYGEQQGEVQQVFHVLEKMEDEELTITALSYAYRLHQQYPEDEGLELMCEDLMLELGKYYFSDIHYFSTEPNRESAVVDSSRNTALRFAFVDLFQDARFKESLSRNFKEAVRWQAARQRKNDELSKSGKQDALALNGFNLGLDQIVYVDPFYQRIDYRQPKAIQYLDSEVSESRMIDKILEYSGSLDLRFSLLSNNTLEHNEIAAFNDLSLLSEWIDEKTQHEDLELVSLYHNEVQYLTVKYDTPNFVWTGAISLTAPKAGKGVNLFAGVMLVPFYPYALYNAVSPNHSTFVYTMVYDIQTGGYHILYPKFVRMRDGSDVMNSVLYDMIFQIKSESDRP